jgi:hypothetical protein
MWVISKEGLIVLGVVAVLGVIGLVLLLQPSRPPIAQPPTATRIAQATDSATTVAAADVPSPTPVESPPTPAESALNPVRALPVTAIDGVIYAGEYAHSTEATGFEIHWANDARTLRVGLISPGTGYLAIGFAPVNRMEGANFILCAVVDGRAVARDDVGTGPVSHGPDVANGGRDDVLEAAGCEVGGETYFEFVEFVIPLDSGDPADKALVPGNTYSILIAYHRTDDDFSAWHSRRGSGTITLDPLP